MHRNLTDVPDLKPSNRTISAPYTNDHGSKKPEALIFCAPLALPTRASAAEGEVE
jgi:hypothetical protein